eukprot:gene6468-3103_t
MEPKERGGGNLPGAIVFKVNAEDRIREKHASSDGHAFELRRGGPRHEFATGRAKPPSGSNAMILSQRIDYQWQCFCAAIDRLCFLNSPTDCLILRLSLRSAPGPNARRQGLRGLLCPRSSSYILSLQGHE